MNLEGVIVMNVETLAEAIKRLEDKIARLEERISVLEENDARETLQALEREIEREREREWQF